MVESGVAQILMDASIVILILGSVIEAVVDIRDADPPEFLPAPLSSFRASHPATLVGVPGLLLLVVGILLESLTFALPGGRFVVGLIAVIAFLTSAGYLIGD
jgi:hypothetical protein